LAIIQVDNKPFVAVGGHGFVATYILDDDTTTWSPVGDCIVSTSSTSNDGFGSAVALSTSDDNTIMLYVTSPTYNTSRKPKVGRLDVYTLDKTTTTTWQQVTQVIGDVSHGQFGTVMTQKDNVIVVSAPYFRNKGAVFIYSLQSQQQSYRLVRPNVCYKPAKISLVWTSSECIRFE